MKRLLACLLAIALVVALGGCSGASTDGTVVGQPSNGETEAIALSGSADVKIVAGGSYSLSGTLTNAKVEVDTTEEVTLELAGVVISNNSGPALQITNAKSVTLTIKAGTKNSLSDGGSSEYNAAIFSNDTLVIDGTGELTITGKNEHGIESDDDICLSGGVITIAAANDGLHANDNITINGGSLHVTESEEGIESKGDIIVNGGTVTVQANDDAFNAALDITFNGGKVYALASTGDGIDSNGTINVKGGTIVTVGGNAPECGIDSDQNPLNITGGTLVAIGGGNSVPSASGSTQCSVALAGSGTTMQIKGSGGAILTFVAPRSYQSLLFSSPDLVKGKTYTVLTGGKVSGGTEFHGLYTGANYSGGTESSTFTTSAVVTSQAGAGGMDGPGGMGGGMMPPGGTGGQRPGGK